jgi:hypothetical protein
VIIQQGMSEGEKNIVVCTEKGSHLELFVQAVEQRVSKRRERAIAFQA